MNSENEKQLEAAVSRELRSLPELDAPDSLARRVMSAIKKSPELPWYRRPWPSWPKALQAVSLVLMLALVGGLCFGSWELSQARTITAVSQRAGEFASRLKVSRDVLAVLVNSMALAVKKLGPVFITACVLSICLAYVLCVGLATVYVRLIHSKVLATR